MSMRYKAFAVAIAVLVVAETADAGRVRVSRTGPRGRRTTVTVRTGFPIVRPMPHVVVRGPATVRVTPRVYLAPVVFTAAVVATIPNNRVWSGAEQLDREDGWTDVTLNVDRRGDKMFLKIDRGAAQINFVEVVFENGESQVVDFNDRVYAKGTYSLIDFRDGRKIDHVRVIAQAETRESEIAIVLTT
jgi:hypothetical protein